jgi:CDP-diacylglycerol--serine O-phosphatidyltransferase
MSESRQHLSMIRSYTAADALTIGNASCGTIAIFLCLDFVATSSPRYLWMAFILLPLALVCDVLDGYVARTQKGRQSVLGGDLDSLADVNLVRRRSCRARFHARAAWRLGHGLPDVLRCLRRQPSREVQRHGSGVVGCHDREGEVFRRHAHSDDDPDCGPPGDRIHARADRRGALVGSARIASATLHPLSLLYVASGSAMISTIRIPKP